MMTHIDDNIKSENACCGGPAIEHTDACCVKDEQAKNSGEAGCGCSSKSEPPTEKTECCN